MAAPIASAWSAGDTRDPYVYGDTIHGVFARQAARHPDAPALLHGDQVVSYGDLAHASDLLAATFASGGLGPGCFAVVRMRRSPQFAAALLAILKLGAAYLAAEQAWPRDYVQDLLDRADAWLVMDDPDLMLASPRGMFVVDAAPVRRGASTRSPVISVSRDAPCTIFQTSGSTGSPKLAVVPHRATVRAFIGAGYADFGPGRVIMQASPVCWDGLTMELWSVLLSGGTSLIPPEGAPVSGDLLRSCSSDYRLDTVWLTSSLFNALVDDDIGAFAGIRQVMSGGERVSPDHVRRLLSAYPGIRFSSGYGPVETTVFATSHTVSHADLDLYGEVPLGRPLPATAVLVLDEVGDPCPPGTVGEIHIGGDALGLGYAGDPVETQRRYVHSQHGLLYRTGDLGEWHGTGTLLFRGRVDRQLKIRGQRVEPEQLERYIAQALPGVVAAVTPLRDWHGQVIGLVAHCGIANQAVDVADIRRACEAGLPPYLRPRRIIIRPELPRNDNGKINYPALEQAITSAQVWPESTVSRSRSDSAEDDITRIASALLGTAVRSDDDFFQLGGDSLFAMRLAARLWREEGIKIPVGQVHRRRTATGLARIAVRNPGGEPGAASGAIRTVSPGEQDLCIHEKVYPGDLSLLVLSAYELHDEIDAEALREAIVLTCTRHPSLSTIRVLEAETIHAKDLTADQVDRQLQIHAEDDMLTQHDGTVVFPNEWLKPFDLARDVPVRGFIAATSSGHRLLGFVMHHAAIDGWSEHIFTESLSRAYDEITGYGGNWEALPQTAESVQPQVAGEAEREHAKNYWCGLLEGIEPLPVPKSQPEESRFAESRIMLTQAQCGALANLPGQHADLHSGALAWYADALKHVFSRVAFTIGSTYAARDLADEEAIGYHVQMIPVVVRYPASKTIAAVASDISEQWMASLDRRSLSLHEIVACVPRSRFPGYRPIFQAGFALQRIPSTDLRLAGRSQRRLGVRPPAPPFEMHLEMWPNPDGGAVACLQWDDSCVPNEVARQIAERLLGTINAFD